MKKIFTLAIASLLTTAMFAQGKKQATHKVLNAKASYAPLLHQMLNKDQGSIISAKTIVPDNETTPRPYGVSAVSPTELGRASNAYTILRGEQNQVYANDGLSLVAFIHRHDVTIYGGGSTENGKYRYDISTDGGATFTKDIGPLQTVYTNYGRYPQITLHNPSSSSNPFDSKFVWNGPANHFPTPGWLGHGYGYADVSATSPITSTEHYLFTSDNALLPGGLCQGAAGEFWSVDFSYDGTNVMDSVYVYKGTYNSGTSDVDWVRHAKIALGGNNAVDGALHFAGPNIAFSPDGQTGWIGIVGDLTGGVDSSYMPIFIKSTDGGATWGTPVEVDLNSTASWIADSLQSLWVDSTGAPASSGHATTGFDYDLTVDANGNPHIGTIIGTTAASSGTAYSISSGLAKFLGDVHSTDGGTTWTTTYIGPVLAFRGEFGTPDPSDGSLLSMDNFVQISRTEDGNKIFYSWLDSDTTVIGFGETDNLAPNLRIAGMRITDGYQTCYKTVTDGDFVWDGKALYMTMAPTVLTSGSKYTLPIVGLDMITNDQLQPCKFWYFGGDSWFEDSDFLDPSTLDLSWGGSCPMAISNDPSTDVPNIEHMIYPNPASASATIEFTLPESATVEVSILNMYGQNVMNVTNGNFSAGQNAVNVNTSNLASGVYFYSLNVNGKVFTEKLVITK